jgi:hypothetical protein
MTATASPNISAAAAIPLPPPRNVRCLLGHAHVDVALSCLGSLQRFSRDPLQLILHDDGSLTPQDIDRLASSLHPEFVRRPDADARVIDELRRYPNCLQWRQNSNYALKIFDCATFETDSVLRQIDSDILFLRPFSGLFELPAALDGAFLTDFESCYSVRSWNLLFSSQLRIANRLNVGVICFRRNCIDLEKIEWFLARPSHRTKYYFLEQTIWSMLAMDVRAAAVMPQENIAVMQPDLNVTDALVAIHFVAMHRQRLPQYLHYSQRDPSQLTPVTLRGKRVRRCTSADLALVETKRILERTVGKWIRT